MWRKTFSDLNEVPFDMVKAQMVCQDVRHVRFVSMLTLFSQVAGIAQPSFTSEQLRDDMDEQQKTTLMWAASSLYSSQQCFYLCFALN